MTSNKPLVSVIIPAYNAEATLAACLKSLEQQTMPRDCYEVIVVDDGSSDKTAKVAQGFDVRVVYQANSGPAAARNRGASLARSPILLFTDADCSPEPEWIAQMATVFAEAEISGVKGAYLTRQPELVARFVQLEHEDRYDLTKDHNYIDFVDTYAAAYRRDVFWQMGGFDTSFSTACVEDQEFSFRLVKSGYRLVFAPQARVYHHHDITVAEYFRRKFRIGYWKVPVMQAYPDKLIHDSHTPQVLKVQIGLAALGGLLLISGIIAPQLAIAGLICWGLLLGSGLPFLNKIVSRDPQVAVIAPMMLFVRAWALGLGLLWGLLSRRLAFPAARSQEN